jgi:hypothetical protein
MDIQELAAAPATAIDRAAVGAHSSAIVPLFAATMFLSGFLLFMVEPMVAKMVLPILGGVPMVWNGCVVFFQIVMLAGYGYAFGASRWLRVRHHVLVHAIVLASPAAVLPFVIQAGSTTPPDGNPILWLLVLLAGTIGLPFFVLSTSASVFQHWLSRTDHPAARDPYFLYGASNLGCLLALASYPVVVEPMFTLREQSRLWTTGYAEFVLLAAACDGRSSPPPEVVRMRGTHRPRHRSRGRGARAGSRSRSSRRASCWRSRVTFPPTSAPFRCCGSFRSRSIS